MTTTDPSADFATVDAESKAAEDARVACAGDIKTTEKDLAVTHLVRLGVKLNFSVLQYEVLENPDEACQLAHVVFKGKIAEPDNVAEDSCKKALITDLFTRLQAESSSEMKALISDSMSNIDRNGLNFQDCQVLFHINSPDIAGGMDVGINEQSPDIAGSVHVGKDDFDDDADLRHARDETKNAAPLTRPMATGLGKKLSDGGCALTMRHR